MQTERAQGFAVLTRTWQAGDVVELTLPMPIRRVVAHEKVAANVGRVALERGPIVYCLEAIDNGGTVTDLFLPDEAPLSAEYSRDLLGGVATIRGDGQRVVRNGDGSPCAAPAQIAAVPYYAWAHRGAGPMAVWLARTAAAATARPAPTIASRSRATASHVWQTDSVDALNDQLLPKTSADHDIPRLTWWDHRGTTEWVQYDLATPTRVSSVEVYWFDDTGHGQCRLPASWRLLYKDEGEWKPVLASGGFEVAKDRFTKVAFTPIMTSALRIEVTLQPGFSGGILEWVMN